MTAKELRAAELARVEQLAQATHRQTLQTIRQQSETAAAQWKAARQEFDLSNRAATKKLQAFRLQATQRDAQWSAARIAIREEEILQKAFAHDRQNEWRQQSQFLRRQSNNDRISAIRRMNAQTLVRQNQAALNQAQLTRYRQQLFADTLQHKRLMTDQVLVNQNQMLNYRRQLYAQRLTNGAALHTQRMAQAQERATQRQMLRGSGGGGGGGGFGGRPGAFGGFAFGPRYGVLTALASLGPIGTALGAAGLVAEAGLTGFAAVAKMLAGLGVAAGAATIYVAKWYEEAVGFNQQANGIIDALAGGNKDLAVGLGDYLRREVARQTPLTTRDTLLMTPKFMSMGKSLSEADFLTQFSSDVAFGLNPKDATRAMHLTEKLVGDVISKGRFQAEEGRQAANLGLPLAMIRQNIFEQWNSAEFQKLNPRVGKLKNVSEVMEKISSGEVGPNMVINAFAAVSNQRLRREKTGEYSVWATNNTIQGLMSQLASFPIEIADVIAQRKGGSADKVMEMLRSFVPTLGSTSSQERIAVGIDKAVTSLLGFSTGFVKNFRGFDFLNDIVGGISAFNWEEFGKFGAESVNWVGSAFKGFMLAMEDSRPKFQSIFGGMMKFFDSPEKVRETTNALIELAVALTDLGATTIKVLDFLAAPLKDRSSAVEERARMNFGGKLNPLTWTGAAVDEVFNAWDNYIWNPAAGAIGGGYQSLDDALKEYHEKKETERQQRSVDPNLGSRNFSGGGAVFGDINIYQQPGEDGEALSQRVVAGIVGELRGLPA